MKLQLSFTKLKHDAILVSYLNYFFLLCRREMHFQGQLVH